jgi:DNA-binding NarL/FixJ family response regulator
MMVSSSPVCENETMGETDTTSYDEALSTVNGCLACLKNGGRNEDILFELSKAFDADDAVFLSASEGHQGVDLSHSFVLRKDRRFLDQYADSYWQFDPLYNVQFSPNSTQSVFKTDDVIPYSQLVNLEYYEAFLQPQDLLGELIIRLNSKGDVKGAISLQRKKEHPSFVQQDIERAQLMVPLLVNIFACADNKEKTDTERMLLERWMESRSEGIILLDTDYRLFFSNAQARSFCFQMNNRGKSVTESIVPSDPPLPSIVLEDCRTVAEMQDREDSQSGANRIVTLPSDRRYYLKYLPLMTSGPINQYYLVFIRELTADTENRLPPPPGQYRLSQREEVIAHMASAGMTNKQIAKRLCISPYTVQNHLKRIFEKTGLDSRTKLASLLRY